MATHDQGISGKSTPEGASLIAIYVFIAMALYNVIELHFIIFATFKVRRGLYFWSFLVATWGIAPYSIGFLLKAIGLSWLNWGYVTLIVVGWTAMVSGQSVALYSRLHIVARNQKLLRGVLWMIVINGVVLHVPIAVMVYGANSDNPGPFIKPYSVYEKVQVTIFFVQEVIISGIYIAETVKLMRAQRHIRSCGNKRLLMNHLILVNIIVVILDITILALEYAGLYEVQTAYKALVYSIKLKVEFSILNKLVEIVQGSVGGGSYGQSHSERGIGGGGSGGTAMRLDPIASEDGNGNGKEKGKGKGGVGKSSFSAWAAGEGPRPTGTAVVMTREVIVRSDKVDRDTDSDLIRDSASIDVADGTATLGFAAPGAEGRAGGRVLSSSEEHLARVTPTN